MCMYVLSPQADWWLNWLIRHHNRNIRDHRSFDYRLPLASLPARRRLASIARVCDTGATGWLRPPAALIAGAHAAARPLGRIAPVLSGRRADTTIVEAGYSASASGSLLAEIIAPISALASWLGPV